MDNKMTGSIVGGLAATMAVGAAAYMMSGKGPKAKKKQIQKKGKGFGHVAEILFLCSVYTQILQYDERE